ncbi:MAG: YetF domain-containing protein, partial [Gaiellaceae bacterium]
LTVAVSYVSFRFPRTRPLLEGQPLVVIQDGEVLENNIRRERLTREELAEAARLQQISSLTDVSWAILEKSGQISFIKKN